MGACPKAGAARRHHQWPACLLLWLCCLTYAACQTAVPPSGSVRPLYACSMQIAELPQFSGSPTPEMLSANIGIATGLQGLLSPDSDGSCKAYLDGASTSSSSSSSNNNGSTSSNGNSSSSSSSSAEEAAVQMLSGPVQARHGRRQQRPARDDSALTAAAAPLDSQPTAAAAAAATGPALSAVPRIEIGGAASGLASTRAAQAGGSAAQSTTRAQLSSGGSSSSSTATTTTSKKVLLPLKSIPAGAISILSQQHPQQLLPQPKPLKFQGIGRHLLAQAAGFGGFDDPWLRDLLGEDEEGEETDEGAHAQAYMDKQFCSKGTWTVSPAATSTGSLTSIAAGQVGIAAANSNSSSSVATASLHSTSNGSVAAAALLQAIAGNMAVASAASIGAGNSSSSSSMWQTINSTNGSAVSISGHHHPHPHLHQKHPHGAPAGPPKPRPLPKYLRERAAKAEKARLQENKPRKPRKVRSKPVRDEAAGGGEELHQEHSAPPRKHFGFRPIWGDEGLWMSESGAVPADATIAAGPRHIVHVVNSLVQILPVDPESGMPYMDGREYRGGGGYGDDDGEEQYDDGYDPRAAVPPPGGWDGIDPVVVTLPDFFGLVASNCDGGYISPSAAFDKQIERFLVTAVCGGDANQILLAVSQSADALGGWWLYSFPGYVTYDTPMACTNGDVHFSPTSIHSQVGYNRDGVYISFVQNCPLCEVPEATGAVLYALPKWALYTGTTQAVIGPVYIGLDVFAAVGRFNDEDYSPDSFRQLQPVLPQRPVDVQADIAYFVNDPVSVSRPHRRTQLATIALINTGSLWQYNRERDPAPLLIARIVGRGIDCSTSTSTRLQQPQVKQFEEAPIIGGGGSGDGDNGEEGDCECSSLDPGAARPRGFWSGGAALFANQIYLVDRGPDAQPQGSSYGGYGDDDDHHHSSSSNRHPTVYWAVLSPSLCASGTCAAFLGQDWAYDEGWDWRTGTWQQPMGSRKKQRRRFFHLQPSNKTRSSNKASGASRRYVDPLWAYLHSRPGRQLLEASSIAAAVEPAAAAAVSAGRRSADQAFVSIAAAAAPAAGKRSAKKPGTGGAAAAVGRQAAVGVANMEAAADPSMFGKGGKKDVRLAGDRSQQHSKPKGGIGLSLLKGSSGGGAHAQAPPFPAEYVVEDAEEEQVGVSPIAASRPPGATRSVASRPAPGTRRSPFLPPATPPGKGREFYNQAVEETEGLYGYDDSYDDDEYDGDDSYEDDDQYGGGYGSSQYAGGVYGSSQYGAGGVYSMGGGGGGGGDGFDASLYGGTSAAAEYELPGVPAEAAPVGLLRRSNVDNSAGAAIKRNGAAGWGTSRHSYQQAGSTPAGAPRPRPAAPLAAEPIPTDVYVGGSLPPAASGGGSDEAEALQLSSEEDDEALNDSYDPLYGSSNPEAGSTEEAPLYVSEDVVTEEEEGVGAPAPPGVFSFAKALTNPKAWFNQGGGTQPGDTQLEPQQQQQAVQPGVSGDAVWPEMLPTTASSPNVPAGRAQPPKSAGATPTPTTVGRSLVPNAPNTPYTTTTTTTTTTLQNNKKPTITHPVMTTGGTSSSVEAPASAAPSSPQEPAAAPAPAAPAPAGGAVPKAGGQRSSNRTLVPQPPAAPPPAAPSSSHPTPLSGPGMQQQQQQQLAGEADADAEADEEQSRGSADDAVQGRSSSSVVDAWVQAWPAPAQVRPPKPFTRPQQQQQQQQQQQSLDSDDLHGGGSSGPLPMLGPADQHHQQHQHQQPQRHPHKKGKMGGKGFNSWTKRLLPPTSNKDFKKRTVWELMLLSCNRTRTPGPHTHKEYYEVWRDYASVRRVYSRLQIEARFNPCKYYRDWHRDTKITFGVLVSRRGVIDQATLNGDNPLGLAFPAVAVREGSALVVYSYSGPHRVPGTGAMAFPGVGYSVIPPGLVVGSPAFNMLKPGDSCIYQGPHPGREQQAWGSYSGADMHFPSAVAYTAVAYSNRAGNVETQPSNAATWLEAFVPAMGPAWTRRGTGAHGPLPRKVHIPYDHHEQHNSDHDDDAGHDHANDDQNDDQNDDHHGGGYGGHYHRDQEPKPVNDYTRPPPPSPSPSPQPPAYQGSSGNHHHQGGDKDDPQYGGAGQKDGEGQQKSPYQPPGAYPPSSSSPYGPPPPGGDSYKDDGTPAGYGTTPAPEEEGSGDSDGFYGGDASPPFAPPSYGSPPSSYGYGNGGMQQQPSSPPGVDYNSNSNGNNSIIRGPYSLPWLSPGSSPDGSSTGAPNSPPHPPQHGGSSDGAAGGQDDEDDDEHSQEEVTDGTNGKQQQPGTQNGTGGAPGNWYNGNGNSGGGNGSAWGPNSSMPYNQSAGNGWNDTLYGGYTPLLPPPPPPPPPTGYSGSSSGSSSPPLYNYSSYNHQQQQQQPGGQGGYTGPDQGDDDDGYDDDSSPYSPPGGGYQQPHQQQQPPTPYYNGGSGQHKSLPPPPPPAYGYYSPPDQSGRDYSSNSNNRWSGHQAGDEGEGAEEHPGRYDDNKKPPSSYYSGGGAGAPPSYYGSGGDSREQDRDERMVTHPIPEPDDDNAGYGDGGYGGGDGEGQEEKGEHEDTDNTNSDRYGASGGDGGGGGGRSRSSGGGGRSGGWDSLADGREAGRDWNSLFIHNNPKGGGGASYENQLPPVGQYREGLGGDDYDAYKPGGGAGGGYDGGGQGAYGAPSVPPAADGYGSSSGSGSTQPSQQDIHGGFMLAPGGKMNGGTLAQILSAAWPAVMGGGGGAGGANTVGAAVGPLAPGGVTPSKAGTGAALQKQQMQTQLQQLAAGQMPGATRQQQQSAAAIVQQQILQQQLMQQQLLEQQQQLQLKQEQQLLEQQQKLQLEQEQQLLALQRAQLAKQQQLLQQQLLTVQQQQQQPKGAILPPIGLPLPDSTAGSSSSRSQGRNAGQGLGQLQQLLQGLGLGAGRKQQQHQQQQTAGANNAGQNSAGGGGSAATSGAREVAQAIRQARHQARVESRQHNNPPVPLEPSLLPSSSSPSSSSSAGGGAAAAENLYAYYDDDLDAVGGRASVGAAPPNQQDVASTEFVSFLSGKSRSAHRHRHANAEGEAEPADGVEGAASSSAAAAVVGSPAAAAAAGSE